MADQREPEQQKQEKPLPVGGEAARQGKLFMPPADIFETDDVVTVVADMPDVQAGALDVTLEENVLTIRGRVTNRTPDGQDLAYAEYDVGDYERSFSLSDRIDADAIEAKLTHGVLTLTLPKVKPAKKRVAVTAG